MARPADFEGKYYDGNAPRGGPSMIGQIKMWWKLQKGSPANPFLSGMHLHKCVCGRTTAMRLFLAPKTHGSMPSAEVFQTILAPKKNKKDADDIFSDVVTDQDAREAGI